MPNTPFCLLQLASYTRCISRTNVAGHKPRQRTFLPDCPKRLRRITTSCSTAKLAIQPNISWPPGNRPSHPAHVTAAAGGCSPQVLSPRKQPCRASRTNCCQGNVPVAMIFHYSSSLRWELSEVTPHERRSPHACGVLSPAGLWVYCHYGLMNLCFHVVHALSKFHIAVCMLVRLAPLRAEASEANVGSLIRMALCLVLRRLVFTQAPVVTLQISIPAQVISNSTNAAK